jgi:hypothetical protein
VAASLKMQVAKTWQCDKSALDHFPSMEDIEPGI